MSKSKKRGILAAALLLVVLLAAVIAIKLPGIRRDVREESRSAIKDAVIRSAVSCYAVEGAFPSSLDYLEEHYGLVVNHEDFIVSYEVFGSNIMPTVDVLVRGEG